MDNEDRLRANIMHDLFLECQRALNDAGFPNDVLIRIQPTLVPAYFGLDSFISVECTLSNGKSRSVMFQH